MQRRGGDDARPPADSALGRLWQTGITVGAAGMALPLAPQWGPFLLSAAMWTAVASLLWSGLAPRWIRRARRRRAGQCLTCGYDLGPLTTCPECGSTKR